MLNSSKVIKGEVTSVTGKLTQLYFDTDDDISEAHKVLSPFLDVTTSVKKEKKRDPRVMVSDMDADLLDKDKLLEAIKQLYDLGLYTPTPIDDMRLYRWHLRSGRQSVTTAKDCSSNFISIR